MLDDHWIVENSPIEPEKLHAMGVITYNWNLCELYLKVLLCALSGQSFSDVWNHTFNQRPSEIFKKIKKAVRTSNDDQQVKDAIHHALDLYDRNRENRAQITHFIPIGGNSNALHNSKSPDFMSLYQKPAINSDLSSLRQAADDITSCRLYLVQICNALSRTTFDQIVGRAGPLPDKPPLPSFLWKTQDPTNTQ